MLAMTFLFGISAGVMGAILPAVVNDQFSDSPGPTGIFALVSTLALRSGWGLAVPLAQHLRVGDARSGRWRQLGVGCYQPGWRSRAGPSECRQPIKPTIPFRGAIHWHGVRRSPSVFRLCASWPKRVARGFDGRARVATRSSRRSCRDAEYSCCSWRAARHRVCGPSDQHRPLSLPCVGCATGRHPGTNWSKWQRLGMGERHQCFARFALRPIADAGGGHGPPAGRGGGDRGHAARRRLHDGCRCPVGSRCAARHYRRLRRRPLARCRARGPRCGFSGRYRRVTRISGVKWPAFPDRFSSSIAARRWARTRDLRRERPAFRRMDPPSTPSLLGRGHELVHPGNGSCPVAGSLLSRLLDRASSRRVGGRRETSRCVARTAVCPECVRTFNG